MLHHVLCASLNVSLSKHYAYSHPTAVLVLYPGIPHHLYLVGYKSSRPVSHFLKLQAELVQLLLLLLSVRITVDSSTAV